MPRSRRSWSRRGRSLRSPGRSARRSTDGRRPCGRGGAGDGIRTRDILLGKQTLCQLSYSRSGDPDRIATWHGAGNGFVSRTLSAMPPRTGPMYALVALVLVLVAALALREIASLIVPFLFGLFLALLASPLVGNLERRGA